MGMEWRDAGLTTGPAKFYTKAVPDGVMEDGTPKSRNELFFRKVISDSTTVDRVANDKDILNHQAAYKAYEDFNESMEIHKEGLHLHSWVRIDPATMAQFFAVGIHTVQEVAAIKDKSAMYLKMPDSTKTIVQDAKALIAASDNSAAMVAKVKKLEGQLAALKEINTELEDEIKLLKAKAADK